MEQKLVQRSETEVDGDACKASYPDNPIKGAIDKIEHERGKMKNNWIFRK